MKVGGYTIRGAMIYVGRGLRSPKGGIDPSLVDPSLPVSRGSRHRTDQEIGYWPSYHAIAPANRGAYLAWLSQGRRNPTAPIGYVFLFMYGLERRVLVDISANKTLVPDLPAIRTEMTALLDMYGAGSTSFRSYATEFIGLIDLMTAETTVASEAVPPPLTSTPWPVPVGLRIGLGQFVAHQQPIPAEWALAW